MILVCDSTFVSRRSFPSPSCLAPPRLHLRARRIVVLSSFRFVPVSTGAQVARRPPWEALLLSSILGKIALPSATLRIPHARFLAYAPHDTDTTRRHHTMHLSATPTSQPELEEDEDREETDEEKKKRHCGPWPVAMTHGIPSPRSSLWCTRLARCSLMRVMRVLPSGALPETLRTLK